MKSVYEALIIIVIAIIIGLVVNTTRNITHLNGLPFDTPWPDNRQRVELEFPPSFDEGDTLISIDDAYNHFLKDDAIFIDAREEEEYDEGHIAGALNLPFEFWDDYWEFVEPELKPETEIIAYSWGRANVPIIFASGDDKLKEQLVWMTWLVVDCRNMNANSMPLCINHCSRWYRIIKCIILKCNLY